jgi:hypothetical protein
MMWHAKGSRRGLRYKLHFWLFPARHLVDQITGSVDRFGVRERVENGA